MEKLEALVAEWEKYIEEEERSITEWSAAIMSMLVAFMAAMLVGGGA